MSLTAETFEAEVRPLYRRLYGAALRLCGDSDTACDLCQEALVKAFRARDRFRPGAALFPWLLRILRNTYLDQVRSARARHERREQDGEFDRRGQPAPQLESLARREYRQHLEAGLARLPEHQSMVLIAVDIEGLDYAEAASVMDLPIGTVRSRLNRARAALRHLVAKQLEPDQGPSRSGSKE